MSKFTSGFKKIMGRSGILSPVLTGILCLLCFGMAFPGTQSAPPEIHSITVEVDGQPGEEDLHGLISLKAGDVISWNKINQSIKQIYRTGLFEDVSVSLEGSDQSSLVFHLTRRMFTRRVFFLSRDSLPHDTLRNGLTSIRESSPFSTDKLNRATEELNAALRGEGIFNARIEAYSEKVQNSSQVDVYFRIHDPQTYRVERISFQGDPLISEKEMLDAMRTRAGQVYIPNRTREDLERLRVLFLSKDYRRAEIRLADQIFNDEEGTVLLQIDLFPHEKIEIVISGAEVPVSLVRPLWEASIFEEWGLDEGEAKILGYLRKKGFLFAQIQSDITREDYRIRIHHQVVPGEKVKIGDMTFMGLTYFTEESLKQQLAIQQELPFFSSIDGARLFELPYEIEFLYKTRGFSETRVELNFERSKAKVRSIFLVEEGRQDIISSFDIEGFSLVERLELIGVISSFEGGPFYQPNVQKDIEQLVDFYRDQGIRGTDIRAQIEEIESGRYQVKLLIEEGERIEIESIVITGNEITRRSTIKREIMLAKGDPARFDLIRETKRRLQQLGIFTEVKIEEIPTDPGKENLLINVREGDRNYMSLGLGLETKNEPRTFQIWNNEIRPRGTAELIRSNIFGTASQISLVGQVSIKEKRGVLSWEQPYFFGLPVRTFLNGWLEREERKSYTYDRRGISLSGIRNLSSKGEMVLMTTLRYARTKLVSLSIAESGVDRQFFPFSTSSISESFIWDRRDDPFNPRKGFFLSSVVEWAYPLFNSESNFQKTFTKYQHYFPLLPKLNFSITSRLGLGRGRIPVHERFFAGGSNSFRGTEFDELGPKDDESFKPVGGKALFVFNAELTFPLVKRLKYLHGVLFYDVGNVFSQRRQVSFAALQNAVGLGLRYQTPLGPVRLEMGWHMDAPEGAAKTLWFITIGNVF